MSRLICLRNKIRTVGGYDLKRLPVQYGYLYNWYCIEDVNGFVNTEDGWDVPSYDDTNLFVDYLISLGYPVLTSAGNQIKSCRQVNSPLGGDCATSDHPRWNEHSTHYGRDIFNFNMLPAGYRTSVGGSDFFDLGAISTFFTKTPTSGTSKYHLRTRNNSGSINTGFTDLRTACSIRFVRLATSDELKLADGTYCKHYTGNDGKKYKTVKIGTQVWMAENLAETKFSNGVLIPFEGANSGYFTNVEWAALVTAGRCAYGASTGINETYVMMTQEEVYKTAPLRAKYK